MSQLNRDALAGIRVAIAAALAPLAASHGVAFRFNSISWTADRATTRLEIIPVDLATPVASTPDTPVALAPDSVARALFAADAARVGLRPEDYGAVVRIAGRAYTILALAPRRPRFPIVVQVASGTRYKMSTEQVLQALGRTVSPVFATR